MVIVDPHIKVDPSYTLYAQAKDKGYFVKDRSGQDFEGICWPGKKNTLSLYFKLFILKTLQNRIIGIHGSKGRERRLSPFFTDRKPTVLTKE